MQLSILDQSGVADAYDKTKYDLRWKEMPKGSNYWSEQYLVHVSSPLLVSWILYF